MIQINKQKDKIVLTLVSELDYEDVQDLVLDLQNWLIENSPLPKFKGIDEKAVKEAKEYSDKKRKLEQDLHRYFVDILDVEAIEKELTTYELDPITKEVITKTKKLKDEKRTKRN